MEDKEKQNIRIILNRWLKRQYKIIEPNGKIRGYGISKNQIEKLKTKLWKNEDCQEETPKTTLNSENNDLQRETDRPKGQNIIKVEGGNEEPFDVSHPDTLPEQDVPKTWNDIDISKVEKIELNCSSCGCYNIIMKGESLNCESCGKDLFQDKGVTNER
jgi:hypothetical protein